MQFGRLLREERLRKNVTVFELGRSLGLANPKSYFSRLETGKVIPGREMVLQIEEALQLPYGILQEAALQDEIARREQKRGEQPIQGNRAEDAILSASKAAELLGVSRNTFTTWCKQHSDLPARKIGSRWYVSREALIAWVSRHE